MRRRLHCVAVSSAGPIVQQSNAAAPLVLDLTSTKRNPQQEEAQFSAVKKTMRVSAHHHLRHYDQPPYCHDNEQLRVLKGFADAREAVCTSYLLLRPSPHPLCTHTSN